MNEDFRDIVLENCYEALRGEKKLSYYDSWPKESLTIQFFRDCYSDVLECVEHTPRKLFSRETPEEWFESDEFLTVLLDAKLLETSAPLYLLEQHRSLALSAALLTREVIERHVRNLGTTP